MNQPTKPLTPGETALIVGAGGKTGRRVAEQLSGKGVQVRAASRSGSTRFDWDDPSTWEPALRGADAAYVTYSPDLAVPEAPEAIREFARLAAAHDLGRVVLLSGRGEEEAQRCEEIFQGVRRDWTVVRSSWFNQNFDEGYFLPPLQQGTLALPAGDIAEPFIDVDDIADVAVAALTGAGHEGRIYEVTGPRLLTFADAVREIGAAAGRDLSFVQVPAEGYSREMEAQQVPEVIIGLTRYLFETVLDGRNAHVTDGVRRALGREPRDFADYAARAAATGIWAEQAARSAS
ncbi:NmrA family transcriptional regulator [Acidobacteria bacterium Mor1]|nr:NmrA family transcriptional regulator [Acidobacteria bacterium Mor1]